MTNPCLHLSASPVWHAPLGDVRMRCDFCDLYMTKSVWRAIKRGVPLTLEEWRTMYLDHVEGFGDLPDVNRLADVMDVPTAVAFVRSHTAARGVDPYAVRPTTDELLAGIGYA